MTDHASRGLLAGGQTGHTVRRCPGDTARAGIHPGGMLMKHMEDGQYRTAMSEGSHGRALTEQAGNAGRSLPKAISRHDGSSKRSGKKRTSELPLRRARGLQRVRHEGLQEQEPPIEDVEAGHDHQQAGDETHHKQDHR